MSDCVAQRFFLKKMVPESVEAHTSDCDALAILEQHGYAYHLFVNPHVNPHVDQNMVGSPPWVCDTHDGQGVNWL